jgi:FtsZ-binding cell division protein ZapB
LTSELEVLELLEERVQRASDLIRGLRRENSELTARLKDSMDRLEQAKESLAKLEEEGRRGDDMARQLKLLQDERQEIRGRVSRMLETFSAMEEVPSSGGHPDN